MSAVALVDTLLDQARAQSASDIHFESMIDGVRVRFRIDGLLYSHQNISSEYASQVLARIKVLANLDVAERRLPQDGMFTLHKLKNSNQSQKSDIDFRVSTFPSLHGEKIVIRLLEKDLKTRSVHELGFDEQLTNQFLNIIRRATGFFLVAGPTGSGKTTTLYATLLELMNTHAQRNIVTLEDPIEYNITGITQGQVQPSIGFTFERGIRSLLRQDPDIIMIGEIRDRETAQVAVQAALTGHLVLSTIHTNDAASVIMRLLDMGVPAFLINATLSGVLAQRLVRVLCPHCKELYELKDEHKFLKSYNINVTHAYKPIGCDLCADRGYKGRTGIFELLTTTQTLRTCMTTKPSYEELVKQAHADGMKTLWQDIGQKIESGVTSIEELIRIVW